MRDLHGEIMTLYPPKHSQFLVDVYTCVRLCLFIYHPFPFFFSSFTSRWVISVWAADVLFIGLKCSRTLPVCADTVITVRTIETQAASRETLVLHHSLPCRHDWDTVCVCARTWYSSEGESRPTHLHSSLGRRRHTVSPLKRASYNYEEKCWNGSSHPWVIGYECNLWHTHSYTRRTQKDWNHKATGHTRLWMIPKQMVLSDQTQKKPTQQILSIYGCFSL